MSYRCRKGCFKDGGRRWHNSHRDCPYEPEYTGPKTSAPSTPPTPATPPEPGTLAASPGGPSLPGAPVPKPPARTIGLGRLVLGGGEPASIASRTADRPAVKEADYVLDPVYTKKAWRIAFGGLQTGLDKATDWRNRDRLEKAKNLGMVFTEAEEFAELRYTPHIDPKVFDFTPFEETSITMDPGSLMVRIPTWVLKQMGCVTLDEAKDLIDEAEFFALFGRMFLSVGDQIYAIYQDSPKLAAARARVAAADKAKAARREGTIDTTGREVSPPADRALAPAG